MTSYIQGKDMFLLPDNSTYHLEVKPGDVHQRILTVGALKRAQGIAQFFDKDKQIKTIHSSREFHIFSGHFRGVGVTVIAIGMGTPMMDFMIREVSFVQPAPKAVIRLGTCGIFNKSLNPGVVVTAGKGSQYVMTDYTYFAPTTKPKSNDSTPYIISGVVPCDQKLNSCLIESLKKQELKTFDGLNVSCETFYACQGRKCANFKDQNEYLNAKMISLGVDSCEMETHQLFHLASLEEKKTLYVAAAAIGIVNRVSDAVNISAEDFHKIEVTAGLAALHALISFQFP